MHRKRKSMTRAIIVFSSKKQRKNPQSLATTAVEGLIVGLYVVKSVFEAKKIKALKCEKLHR